MFSKTRGFAKCAQLGVITRRTKRGKPALQSFVRGPMLGILFQPGIEPVAIVSRAAVRTQAHIPIGRGIINPAVGDIGVHGIGPSRARR